MVWETDFFEALAHEVLDHGDFASISSSELP